MLSQKYRISNQRLISKLNKEGKRFKTSHFVFKFLPSHSGDSGFAVVVSKKTSSKAVTRNRLKRQITESLRLNITKLPSPMVCLVIMKNGMPEELNYTIIDAQIREFFNHSTCS